MLFIILQAIALGISFYICLGFGNHCMKNSGLRITIGNSSAVGHYYWIRLDADKNCTLAPSDLACLHEFFLDIGATFLTGIGILVGVVVLLHSFSIANCQCCLHHLSRMLQHRSHEPSSSSRQSKQDESLVMYRWQ